MWRYDFQFDGARYVSADPHYSTKAKADAAEKAAKKAMRRGTSPGPVKAVSRKAPLATSEAPGSGVTLGRAADRYWTDIGARHRSASDIKRRIAICKRLLGEDTDVARIGTAAVIAAMQERMKEQTLTRYGAPSGKLVTGPGANRDVIDTLRPILNYAAVVFEDEGLVGRVIKWKVARQAESEEIVCEFSDAEIEAWGAALIEQQQKHGRDGVTECAFLTLAMRYGPRLGELFFPPAAFKPDAQDGPELELGRYIGKGGVRRASRKDKSLHAIPLTADDVAMLTPFIEAARAARTETVWLEEDGQGEIRPISYDAMRARLVRAAKKAGIDKARLVHGMRHHAGEQMERIGGLARVQQLLGHKQITTSRRYAKGRAATLRADLDQIVRKSPAQVPPSAGALSR